MGNHGEFLIRRSGDENIDQVSHYYTIFNEIIEVLQDDKTYSLALLGTRGCGKSTFAKEVGRRAKDLNVFDLVVFVAVAETGNCKKILNEIAKGLGLTLMGEETLVATRQQVSIRLQSKERILIILDDIRKPFDLQHIGVPSYDNHKSCKVLFSTCYRSTLNAMRCQRIFNLYLLNDKESWSLFSECAGIDDNINVSQELIGIAHEVVNQCKGLPLAIVVAGGSLRGKTVEHWKVALNILQGSRGNMGLDWEDDDGSKFLNRVIQLSYNGLSSKVAKSLFLMCGLFPQDHRIPIEDLCQSAIRLGLCDKINDSAAIADQSQVHAAINSLVNSGLLMHSDASKDHVIMHNIVRDMAHRIILEENPEDGDSIEEYLASIGIYGTSQDHCNNDFQWYEELCLILHQLYHVKLGESSSSSASNVADLQVAVERSCTHVAKILPRPSGKMVDFYGLCQVDKSFLPLLKKACARKPQLIESQKGHSEMLRQCAFDSLGRLLFLLQNVRIKDWVYLEEELQIYWEQTKVMKFDLEWLTPVVERVLSLTEVARIKALQVPEEDQKNRDIAEAPKDEAVVTNVSKARIVSKVTHSVKLFFKK